MPLQRCMLLLAGVASTALSVKADDDWRYNGQWTRHFRVGLQLGLNMHADFSAPGVLSISGSQPGATGVSGVNHVYDDGYVRVDETGNAGGYTSYWGYSSASQYDQAHKTLTYHSAESFSLPGNDRKVDDAPYVGFDMAYGGDLTQLGKARIGWELGFGLLPISIQNRLNSSGTFARTIHQFDAGIIELPTAPFNGGPSGIGATIHDTATGLPDEIISGTVTGARTLDVTLYTLRLGPTVRWNLHRRWSVSAGGGAAIGLVTGDYRFDESALFANGGTFQNAGKFGKTRTVYGGYLNAMVLFHLEANSDLFLGAQFMSLSNAKFSNGERQAQLNSGAGVSFTAGLSWPF